MTPGWGGFPGGHGSPLKYSCLENPMDRGGWRATVHGVTKGWTQLSDQAHKQSKIILTVFSFRYHALIRGHYYM